LEIGKYLRVISLFFLWEKGIVKTATFKGGKASLGLENFGFLPKLSGGII
jgi:hypothetical protein